MNRRSFIKSGALWVPTIFSVVRARGQVLTLADPATIGRSRPVVSGSCSTLKDSATLDDSAAANLNNEYLANKFTTSSAYALCKSVITIFRNASYSGKYFLEVRPDGSSQPSETILGTSDEVPNSSVGTTKSAVAFEFASAISLSSATSYWLVLKLETIAFPNSWETGNGSPESIMRSTTGLTGSWTSVTTTRQGMFLNYASS